MCVCVCVCVRTRTRANGSILLILNIYIYIYIYIYMAEVSAHAFVVIGMRVSICMNVRACVCVRALKKRTGVFNFNRNSSYYFVSGFNTRMKHFSLNSFLLLLLLLLLAHIYSLNICLLLEAYRSSRQHFRNKTIRRQSPENSWWLFSGFALSTQTRNVTF